MNEPSAIDRPDAPDKCLACGCSAAHNRQRIVELERLLDQYRTDDADEVLVLRAEIERLKECLRDRVDELEAQIETLQGAVRRRDTVIDICDQRFASAIKKIKEQGIEIERLTDESCADQLKIAELANKYADAKAEIERLTDRGRS